MVCGNDGQGEREAELDWGWDKGQLFSVVSWNWVK